MHTVAVSSQKALSLSYATLEAHALQGSVCLWRTATMKDVSPNRPTKNKITIWWF